MFNIHSLALPVHSVGKALGCPNLGPNTVTKWLIFLFWVNKCPDVILCCVECYGKRLKGNIYRKASVYRWCYCSASYNSVLTSVKKLELLHCHMGRFPLTVSCSLPFLYLGEILPLKPLSVFIASPRMAEQEHNVFLSFFYHFLGMLCVVSFSISRSGKWQGESCWYWDLNSIHWVTSGSVHKVVLVIFLRKYYY